MAAYTLGQAAKRVGKSKATLSKAIKTGKISAVKGENGAFQIEHSELHRVYDAVSTEQLDSKQVSKQEIGNELIELRVKLEAANKSIEKQDTALEDMKKDRDDWKRQANNLLSFTGENKAQKGFFARIFGS